MTGHYTTVEVPRYPMDRDVFEEKLERIDGTVAATIENDGQTVGLIVHERDEEVDEALDQMTDVVEGFVEDFGGPDASDHKVDPEDTDTSWFSR